MSCEITNKLTLNSVELLIDDFTTPTASISHVILSSAMLWFFTISNYEVMESCRFSDLTDEEISITLNEYLVGKYFQSIE